MSPELRSLDFAGDNARYNAAALAAAEKWAWVACGLAGDQTDPYGLPWLFLYGWAGVRQEYLLAAAFNALMPAHDRAGLRYPLYTVVPALLDRIREGLDDPKRWEGRRLIGGRYIEALANGMGGPRYLGSVIPTRPLNQG